MDCGEATAAAVDEEVMRILKDSYEEAKRLLSENRDVLDQIAAFLIEKETITGGEMVAIIQAETVQDVEKAGEPETDIEHDTEEKKNQNEA